MKIVILSFYNPLTLVLYKICNLLLALVDGALKCFSNITRAESIIKKIGADVVQLLLAHGFQVTVFISVYIFCLFSVITHQNLYEVLL